MYSRSALQNDGFVKKISDYITKKVADKSDWYVQDRAVRIMRNTGMTSVRLSSLAVLKDEKFC